MSDTRGDGSGVRHGDPFAELAGIVDGEGGPRGTRWPASRAPRGPDARAPFYGDDEPSQAASLGLCDPATPRIALPAETGILAPERYLPEPEIDRSTPVLDDFDELIASEMAALKPAQAAWQPEEPAFDSATEYAAEAYEAPVVSAAAMDGAAPRHGEGGPAGLMARAPWERSVVGDSRRRRAMFFGGGLAAVALVGVFGAYAGSGLFAGGLIGDGEPILIRAETGPVKMAPAEPGGRVIPNQNKAVYQRVARDGPASGAPAQDMLISAAETPVDISFEDQVSNLPGVMVGMDEFAIEGEGANEVEIAQVAASPQGGAVPSILQPHRVRTYEVRPDGTLVPREEPAVGQTLDPVDAVTQPAVPFSVELDGSAQAAPAQAPAEGAPTQAPEPEPTVAATPEPAPAADDAPETAPAAAEAPVPSDAFFVQISSQPSEALARESMAAMQSRYASAIGGRNLTIQPAEIDGRGTFYRVRVVAASRDEANSVCATLQSAGGSCFVTR